MSHPFSELIIGGILIAPFVAYAVAALAIIIVIRPILYMVGFGKLFSHPSIAEFSLYAIILGLLVLSF